MLPCFVYCCLCLTFAPQWPHEKNPVSSFMVGMYSWEEASEPRAKFPSPLQIWYGYHLCNEMRSNAIQVPFRPDTKKYRAFLYVCFHFLMVSRRGLWEWKGPCLLIITGKQETHKPGMVTFHCEFSGKFVMC